MIVSSSVYSVNSNHLKREHSAYRMSSSPTVVQVLKNPHVKMLEEAKRQYDYLIVGLQLDPSIDRPEKNAPSQSIIERYI